jgi:5-methylthioadenosine/S-adenosylhomocysteine deaminase
MSELKDGGRGRLLITGGIVVTMDLERRIFQNGAILIKGDKIEAVGKADELVERYHEVDRFNADNKVILPGFVNTHVHLSEHIVRGLIPDDANDWMSRWLMPIYASLSYEDEYTSAMLAFIEMLKTGTTTFCEAGTLMHPEAAAKALNKIGLRGILGRWTWDLPSAPARMKQTAKEALKANQNFIEMVRKLSNNKITAWPLILGMGTASEELMRGAKELADHMGLGMGMMHSSNIPSMETRESIQSLQQFKKSGLLGSNLKLTHMVYLDDKDIELLDEHHIKISHCPNAAMKHCKGLTKFARFPEMLQRGICISLGGDSANSSDHSNMLRIMQVVACLYKDINMKESVMPAETVLEMATLRGAEALLMEEQIGSIEPTKNADLVLFDRNHPEWRPLLNIPNSIVYSVSEASISTVFIGGEIVLDQGKIKNVDANKIYRNAEELALKLINRANLTLPSRWPLI